jgi:hypothetical protein
MTALQIVTLYLGTMDRAALTSALADVVQPGDTEADVERLCIELVDAMVPDELLPLWQDAAQDVIEDAGQRLARLVLRLVQPAKVDRSRRRLSPAVERALSDAARARARAAEIAALPTVEVTEPA